MEMIDLYLWVVFSDDYENLLGFCDGVVMENFRKDGEDDIIK